MSSGPIVPAATERLVFRTWSADDLGLAMGLWGDPRVTALVDARPALDEAAVRDRLAQEIARQRDHGVSYWPIFLRATGEHVGCCGLRPRASGRGDCARAPEARVFELGFHVCHAFWRRGFALEAARATVDCAFGPLGATSLFAGHNPKNTASRALLEKLGFCHTHDELYPPTGLLHPSYRLERSAG